MNEVCTICTYLYLDSVEHITGGKTQTYLLLIFNHLFMVFILAFFYIFFLSFFLMLSFAKHDGIQIMVNKNKKHLKDGKIKLWYFCVSLTLKKDQRKSEQQHFKTNSKSKKFVFYFLHLIFAYLYCFFFIILFQLLFSFILSDVNFFFSFFPFYPSVCYQLAARIKER